MLNWPLHECNGKRWNPSGDIVEQARFRGPCRGQRRGFTIFVTFLGFTGYQSRMTFAVAYKVLKFHGWVFPRQRLMQQIVPISHHHRHCGIWDDERIHCVRGMYQWSMLKCALTAASDKPVYFFGALLWGLQQLSLCCFALWVIT